MSEHSITEDVLWVLVMNNGTWVPESKFAGGKVVSAMKHAEELDKSPDFDGVKIVRIVKGATGPEQKEVWFSSRLNDRMAAKRSNQLSAALAQSADSLSAR